MTPRSGLARVLPVVALLLGPATARAAQVSLNPVQARLSQAQPTAILALTNRGQQAARFELSLFAWSERADGEMELKPTDDVLFFPQLFELKPGETRRIRVGAKVPFGASEKSYRAILEEVPPLRGGRAQGIQVLTRLSVPVFFEPASGTAQPRIESLPAAARAVGFRVVNGGEVHLRPAAVLARGVGGDGSQVFEQRWNGWYLLAGGVREYHATVPKDACRDLRALEVEVVSGEKTLRRRIDLARGACTP